jgi:HD-GYP domain-containing protein (c-di-GMP phosphodiesterase class II)
MATSIREIAAKAFTAVSKERLVEGTRLPFTVYINERGSYVAFFNAGTMFTHFALEVLADKGISEVYVAASDTEMLEGYLSRNRLGKSAEQDEKKVFKQYSAHKEEHHQVDKKVFVKGSTIMFGIFLLNKFNLKAVMEASEAKPAVIDQDMSGLEGDLVIRKADIPLFNEYIKSLTTASGIPKEERTRVKAVSVKENSKLLMKDLLEDPRSGQNIKKSVIAVNNMIDCILENSDTIYDLLSLRSYDYYTYTHSVNVAVMSIGLGAAVGLNRAEIEKLGMGTLMHDIGKSAVPHDVLNKQGKLNENEFRLIQNHVIEGETILRDHAEFPAEALPAVLQHHEKISGKGYPFRLKGNAITKFGRISAIADCYDALTTQRPYKPAFAPFYALSLVAKETGDYDPFLLAAFIKMLGKIK